MYCTLVAYHLSVISHAQDPWSREAACLDVIIQEASLCPIEQQSADRLPPPNINHYFLLSAPLSQLLFHLFHNFSFSSSSRRIMKLWN